jgi:hypothetical protein
MKRIVLFILVGLLSVNELTSPAFPYINQRTIFLVKKQTFEKAIYMRSLTSELLLDALYYSEIIMPEIVYKQAQIESGNFTSQLFRDGNNLFGMKLAHRRQTTAIGQIYHHAKYSHWYDSIKDYKYLQDFYLQRGHKLNNYYLFLEDIGYAQDKNYIKKLKSVL